jgi:hypothetical protein
VAIKAQIEADKKARAEKFAREKAIRDGQPIPDESSAPAPAPSRPVASSAGVAGKDYQETRLQIRMSTGGQPHTTTLRSDACEHSDLVLPYQCTYVFLFHQFSALREVAEYLAGQNLDVDVETVSLAQHFPRFLDPYPPFPYIPDTTVQIPRMQESFLSGRFIKELEGARAYSLCSKRIYLPQTHPSKE